MCEIQADWMPRTPQLDTQKPTNIKTKARLMNKVLRKIFLYIEIFRKVVDLVIKKPAIIWIFKH